MEIQVGGEVLELGNPGQEWDSRGLRNPFRGRGVGGGGGAKILAIC